MSQEPAVPCAFPAGKLLYCVEHDGRKAVVETWKVTQHRVRAYRSTRQQAMLSKEWLASRPKDACLMRIDPPPASWKGKPFPASIRRDKVPLDARIQDTKYAASIPAAARKGLARAEAAQARWQGCLTEEGVSVEEAEEIKQDLDALRYAISAIKRLLTTHKK